MARRSYVFLKTAVFLASFQVILSDRAGQPFDRLLCLQAIEQEVGNNTLSINDEDVFFVRPADLTSPVLNVPACRRICGDGFERKRDCLSRVKDWMWPVLLLLVVLEPTAALTVGWSSLVLYFFALGDPIGMLHGLLHRVRHERLCKKAGIEVSVWMQDIRGTQGTPQPENYGILISAMSDILGDIESAKEALQYALLRQPGLASGDQDAAVHKAAASLGSFGTRGVPAAWIAVAVCIVDLGFLVIQPLQQQSSEPPSGAKFASAAAFSGLMPLVLLHAYYGKRVEPGRVRKEVIDFLGDLNSSRPLIQE